MAWKDLCILSQISQMEKNTLGKKPSGKEEKIKKLEEEKRKKVTGEITLALVMN